MSDRLRLATLTVVLGMAATSAVGHGASEGLHLHLTPDPATPGERISVRLTAAEPFERFEVGFVGAESVAVRVDPPREDTVVALVVPASTKTATLNCHAEAFGVTGAVWRASAVLRIGGSLRR